MAIRREVSHAHGKVNPMQAATDTPATIADYVVIKPIGQGGMGQVFLAHQPKPSRDVALKVIHPHLAGEEVRARFGREANALARLNHPNVVAVYAFGEDNGRLYLAMENIHGRSLRCILREAKTGLDVHRAMRLGLQILNGLRHAHGRSVIHRDLKPSNILITQVDGVETAKLVDFGLARFLDGDVNVTKSGRLVGSAPYMSPEQWEEAAVIDDRVDVYAFGVLLFEMMTGKLPFAAKTPAGFMRAHLLHEPRNPVELRPELVEHPSILTILREALTRHPGARPSATDLREFFEASEPRIVLPGLMTGAPNAEVDSADDSPGWSPRDVETSEGATPPWLASRLPGELKRTGPMPVEAPATPALEDAPRGTATYERATPEPVTPLQPNDPQSTNPLPGTRVAEHQPPAPTTAQAGAWRGWRSPKVWVLLLAAGVATAFLASDFGSTDTDTNAVPGATALSTPNGVPSASPVAVSVPADVPDVNGTPAVPEVTDEQDSSADAGPSTISTALVGADLATANPSAEVGSTASADVGTTSTADTAHNAAPDASDSPDTEATAETTDTGPKAQPSEIIWVASKPKATLYVDNKRRGRTPQRVVVPAEGAITLSFRKRGYGARTLELTAEAARALKDGKLVLQLKRPPKKTSKASSTPTKPTPDPKPKPHLKIDEIPIK